MNGADDRDPALPPRRGWRAPLAAALTVLALAGCGVRLESPPPEVPAANRDEQARQEAARDAAELHAAARAARGAAGDDAVGAVLIAVETAATEHHAALGGVWEPWPGAGPEATAFPGSATAPPTSAGSTTPADVLDLLEDGAVAARDGAVGQVGDLGQLLASVAISRNYLAADLAAALDVGVETLPAEPQPVPDPGSVDPETSRAIDAARYALEVVAARSSGDQRSTAEGRAARLAAIAGAVPPDEDTRDVAYDITAAAEDPDATRALAGAAELDVLRAYLALLGSDTVDREVLLAAATHAAGRARSWDTTLPPLPGLS